MSHVKENSTEVTELKRPEERSDRNCFFFPLTPDMLVMQLLDPNATCLPSPNQLKRRVLIKHKKLMVEGEVEGGTPGSSTTVVSNPLKSNFASFLSDLSNSRQNGYLFIEDPIDRVRGIQMHVTCLGVCAQYGTRMCQHLSQHNEMLG